MQTFIKNLFKNRLWFYAYIALLIKCIIFLGITLDKTHTFINITSALKQSFPYLVFYSCFIIIPLSFAFLFKNKARLWFLLICNLLLSMLLLIDVWYYRGFETMPSLYLLQQSANLNNLSDSVLSLVKPVDILFIIDILIIFIFIVIRKDMYKDTSRSLPAFALLLVIPVCILSYVPVKVEVFGFRDINMNFYHLYDPNLTSKDFSPIGYHVFNAYSYWKDSRPYTLSQSEKSNIKKWFEDKKEDLPDNRYKALFKGKNLIVIQVESMERFTLEQSINGIEITPNLNKLLKHSLYFTNIREQVNQGQSSDADLLTNTSIYPVREGSTFFRYPYTAYNSLPKLLGHGGYSTLAIHSDKGSYWNWMTALKSIGFDKCMDATCFNNNEIIGMGLSDGSYFKQVEPVLVKQKQPFYSFIVTLSSHAPFDLPAKYRELNLKPELGSTTLGGYFESMHYVDSQIGALVQGLQKDGLLDNTVIVITGDHCGVHKFYPGDIKKIQNPEDWWLDNNHQIPFIIYQNGIQEEMINTLGGQVDYLPTLSYLMGVDEKSYINTAMGRNLLKTNRSFAVTSGRGYVCDKGNESFKDTAVKGLDIADLIIRSNYFK